MKLNEGICIAIITVGGSSLASFLTGKASSDSAMIQAEASLKAATAQIEAARKSSRSEAAMKVMEFRSAPIGDVYVANSKLQAAASGAEMNAAARQLAVAASAAAARLDGKVGSLCMDIADKANYFAQISDSQLLAKADARGKLAAQVTELKYEFESMQRQIIDSVLL